MKTLTVLSRKTRIEQAITSLRRARRLLVEAEAPKAADKVRKALKSAEGAERHVWGKVYRENRAAAAAYDVVAENIGALTGRK